jgi:hypothetical protein
MVFKKSLYQEVGGMNINYKFLCDWDLFFKFLWNSWKRSKQVLYIDKGYVGWRVHAESITGTMELWHFNEHKIVVERIADSYKEQKFLTEKEIDYLLHLAENYRYRRLIDNYYRYKNFDLPDIPLRYKVKYIYLRKATWLKKCYHKIYDLLH